jgi:hypothetical protein
VSVLQTVLVFVLVPLGIYLLIALLAASGRLRSQRKRYRPGDRWSHAPVWWSANPAGAELPKRSDAPTGTVKGGADGGW